MPTKRKYGSKARHNYLDGYYVVLGSCFIIYQILSSIFAHLPLLIGFFYCYAFLLLDESRKNLQTLDFRWYFMLFYLLLIDITYDFYLFSSWLAFVIFYYLCADYIRTSFKLMKFLPIIFVLCAYALEFGLDIMLSYIDNAPLKIFNLSYLIDIFIESLLCFFLFKDKLK